MFQARRLLSAADSLLTSGRSARWTRLNLDTVLRLLNSSGPRESQLSDPATDLLTGHKPAQEDITARNYLDRARLDWLQPTFRRLVTGLSSRPRSLPRRPRPRTLCSYGREAIPA